MFLGNVTGCNGCKCCGDHLFGSGDTKCDECPDDAIRNITLLFMVTITTVFAVMLVFYAMKGGEELRDVIVTHLAPLTVVLSFWKLSAVVVTLGDQWTVEVKQTAELVTALAYFDMSAAVTHPQCFTADKDASPVTMKLVASVVVVSAILLCGAVMEWMR